MNKLLSILLLLILFSSCKKEFSNTFTPDTTLSINDTSWINQSGNKKLADSIAQALNSFSFYVDSFYANQGKEIHFNTPDDLEMSIPASSCRNPSNNPIVNGMITVRVMVVKTKGDYIRALLETSSNAAPLQSLRCFYVEFIQNNNYLRMAPGTFYELKWGEKLAIPTMQLYVGQPTPDSSLNWLPATFNTGKLEIAYHPNNTSYPVEYELYSSATHWVGAYQPIDSSNGTTRLNVVLPPNFTNKNTIVYAVFNNKNTVLKLKPDYASRVYFANGIPLNTATTIISISKIDNTFYWGSASTTATNANQIIVNPSQKSIADINTLLNGL